MKILLDTHTFIWFVEGSKSLTSLARKTIDNPNNISYVSIASLWEMSIKVGLKKLKLNSSFSTVIDDIRENNFEILPIDFWHTLENTKLAAHHRDPFDRLLIAQAIVEDMQIITADDIFDKYKVKRIWK